VPDTNERLIHCFQAVFPDLSEAEATRATSSNIAAWDSVATVTLAAVVEEEFCIQFQVDDIEKMNSFQNYLRLLDGQACSR
jgi:acyl carrier protein